MVVIHHTRADHQLYVLIRCSGIWLVDQVGVKFRVLVVAVSREIRVLV